jgi:ribonuclease T1
MTRRTPVLVLVAFAVGLAVGLALGVGSSGHPDPGPTTAPQAMPRATSPAPAGLPVVALADLPSEAGETVALIDAGGPFPFDQDGAVFENRERRLPDRPRGHYREFTVETRGSPDRGPRRIVVGQDGAMYWTADHYDSFAWIAR